MNKGHILIAWLIFRLARIVMHSAAAEWNSAWDVLRQMEDDIREGERLL